MLVILTSSPTGALDGSRKVVGLDKKNHFVDHLRKYWKPGAKNLMITATPDSYEQNDEMISFFENAVKTDGFSCAPFEVWDLRTKDFSTV